MNMVPLERTISLSRFKSPPTMFSPSVALSCLQRFPFLSAGVTFLCALSQMRALGDHTTPDLVCLLPKVG